MTGCYYKVHYVLQSEVRFYYKVCQVLQSATDFITKCDSYYKVRRYVPCQNMLKWIQSWYFKLAIIFRVLKSFFKHLTKLIRPIKVVLFLEIDRVKKILSPTRPHVYENIYLLFKKNTHINKKNFTSKFIRTNLCFFPSNNKI